MKTGEYKILVIGAGGIGGYTAAHIARAGYSIEVVDCLPGLAHRINTIGIKAVDAHGSFIQKIRAFENIKDVHGKKDIVLIATKVNALPYLTKNIPPLLKKNSVIVTLQNGMGVEYLTGCFGKERMIGCAVGWGATVHEPGHIEKTSTGAFTIGSLSKKPAHNFDIVRDLLSTAAPVKTTQNIYGVLYSKLIINSCITTMGAISGLTLGKMLSKYEYRKIFIDTISEALQVGKARGIFIEKYAGKIDFYEFAEKNDWYHNLKKHLIIYLVGLKYRKLKSSSLQSLQTGRKTEIDYLNGYIAQQAQIYQLKTPMNNWLIRSVKEIESGIRTISPENVKHSIFHKHLFTI
ncbi:MAG: 2-dehydropantoate 2-reductase [Bacteroidetes bacterium]|nr:2-dehydropantoate 2-reductase [Bacteroidota bacterium]